MRAPDSRDDPPAAPGGIDVDPRVTFANERTFLAWVRTALALIAGGVAVGVAFETHNQGVHAVIAIAPIVLGAGVALIGYRRWSAADAALRAGSPLPVDRTLLGLAVTIGLVAVGAAIATLIWVLN
jgi:putative membrane protein